VEGGEAITITRHGKPVARLIPLTVGAVMNNAAPSKN
jgi:antitoxin (DNA-binding transcriptional repressor) of toxin-antitoxin stability system